MIVLLESVHPDAHDLLASAGEVVSVADPPVFDSTIPVDRVRALVTRGRGEVTSELIQRLPNLEVVARCGVGLDNVDTHAAASADVMIVHAPGSMTHAVAEHALMLMLGLARRIAEVDAAVKRGRWEIREGFESLELSGKRLGVIGLGAVGSRVADLGRALDMDVVGWTRGNDSAFTPRLELDELLMTSDIVQLCLALNPETTGLIGAAQFSAMKPGALLVNTARGPIVDHEVLRGALAEGSLGGYAADVWDPDPPDADDTAIADPRVLITPHVAGLTDVTYREICVRPAAAVAAVLMGAEPDGSCIYSPKERRR